jgi:hypothetical protein
MRKVSRLFLTAACGLALLGTLGCDSRAHKTDSGGVILVISDFDELPAEVSVSATNVAGGAVTIGSLTLQSNIAQPGGGATNLMDVEIQSYEVTFSRGDTGTRLPPSLVQPSLIYVPAGGSTDLNNLRILQSPQLSNTPLSDLQNFGIDRETGSSVVILNIRLRFFGKTIGGRDVATEPRAFTVEFRQ